MLSEGFMFYLFIIFLAALKVPIFKFQITFPGYLSALPALHPGFSNPLSLNSTVTTLLLLNLSYL